MASEGKAQSADCKSQEYGNITLHYDSYAPATGDTTGKNPIILMHGLVATKETWIYVAQRLANETKRKVYAYDARSHGKSDSKKDFNFDVVADDLFNFMSRVGIKKAVLIGHKLGAQTAFRAAFRKPEMVEAVISEDTYVKKLPKQGYVDTLTFLNRLNECCNLIDSKITDPTAATKALFDIMAEKYSDDKTFMGEMESLIKAKYAPKLKSDGSGYETNCNKASVAGLLEKSDTSIGETSGKFEGRALFICGANSDYKVFNEVDDIMTNFPNAKIFQLEEASHHPHSDNPDLYIKKIVQFLYE